MFIDTASIWTSLNTGFVEETRIRWNQPNQNPTLSHDTYVCHSLVLLLPIAIYLSWLATDSDDTPILYILIYQFNSSIYPSIHPSIDLFVYLSTRQITQSLTQWVNYSATQLALRTICLAGRIGRGRGRGFRDVRYEK